MYLAVSGQALTDQSLLEQAIDDLPPLENQASPEIRSARERLVNQMNEPSLRFSKFVQYQTVAPDPTVETGDEPGPLDSAIDTEQPFHNWFMLGGRGEPGRWALKLESKDDKTLIVTRLDDDSLAVLSLHEGTYAQCPADAICVKTKAGSFIASNANNNLDDMLLDRLAATSTGILLDDASGRQAALSFPPVSTSLDTLDETLSFKTPGSALPIIGAYTSGTVSFGKPSIAPHSNLALMRIHFQPSDTE